MVNIKLKPNIKATLDALKPEIGISKTDTKNIEFIINDYKRMKEAEKKITWTNRFLRAENDRLRAEIT